MRSAIAGLIPNAGCPSPHRSAHCRRKELFPTPVGPTRSMPPFRQRKRFSNNSYGSPNSCLHNWLSCLTTGGGLTGDSPTAGTSTYSVAGAELFIGFDFRGVKIDNFLSFP